MIAPFHIGQRVVAIKGHDFGFFKKGDEFTVLQIRKSCCQWVIDIGVSTKYSSFRCAICKSSVAPNWFACSRFAPIQEISNETFESIEQWIAEQEAIEI